MTPEKENSRLTVYLFRRIAVVAGIFSAVLGSGTPIEVPFDGPVWLEVEVGGEVLSPRRQLVSVPYAFHSIDSDSLGGLPADRYVVKGESGVVTVEMIVGGTGSGLDADMVDGLNADAFTDTGHVHDDRYYKEEELNTPGTLNDPSNRDR